MENKIKKGNTLKLEITDYAFEGKGISKIDNNNDDKEKKFVIFVKGSYPGDIVEAKIVKKKKSFAEAKTEKILRPAKERITPKCRFFGTCGGCKSQDLDYEKQVEFKEKQVFEIIERIGKVTEFEKLPIIPSENIFRYRNKMEFSFSNKRWITTEEINSDDEITDRNFALGLHIPKIYDKVLDIDECFLQPEINDSILNFTRKFFKEKNIPIYSTQTHTGFLRHLVIKNAHHTKEILVNLVTSSEEKPLVKEYAEMLIKEIPQITTVVNNVNLRKSQTAFGDFETVLYGNGFIFDFIGKKKFRISANSFFQTNTLQAEKLYDTVIDFAEFSGDEILFDLYSGAGTIAIYVSSKVAKIYAVESVNSAVEDAKINAKLNNIGNIEFIKADLNKSFYPIATEKKIPNPDIIIADPPRAGMNPKTINDILKFSPKKIVYVSCNPATQARDISILNENGYELIKIRPVDMFPHTFHIENVALLVKTKEV